MIIETVKTEADWMKVVAIRTAIFIQEQACPPEEEWDEYDATSRHLLGTLGDEPVATARWRTVARGSLTAAKLERFAVLPAYRGRGLGRALVAFTISDAEAAGYEVQTIHAQAHLQAFYASLGFEPYGETFWEAGILHIGMTRDQHHQQVREAS